MYFHQVGAAKQPKRPDPADETVINGTPYKATAGAKAVAARAAYRDPYMRDQGLGLDEWLNETESEH